MGHLHLIGTSNFRTFKNPSRLEFSPINIISGINNSGKSSISKLLLLIKDSFDYEYDLQELTFRGQGHYLAYFENIINSDSEDKSLHIELPFKIFDNNNYIIRLKYEASNKKKSYTASCKEISIISKQDNTTIIEASITPIPNVKGEYYESAQLIFNLKADIDFLQAEAIRWKPIVKKYLDDSKDALANLGKITPPIFNPYGIDQTIDLDQDAYKSFQERIDNNSVNISPLSLTNERISLSEKREIFKTLSSFIKIGNTRVIKDKQYITGYDIENWTRGNDKDISTLDYIKYFSAYDEGDENSSDDDNKTLRSLLQEIFNIGFREIRPTFDDSFEYLPLTRNNIERLHYLEGGVLNDIISDLEEHVELKEFSIERKFIEDWIKKFKINNFNSIQINSFPEFNVCTLSLVNRDSNSPFNVIGRSKVLADLGFGTSQLIILLSKIVLAAAKNSSHYLNETVYKPHLLLIEEPEAHLHPKWQSLLADVMIDASDKFKTQFIIETHSEYIIRRLQYHIAIKTINNEVVNVFHVEQTDNNESSIRNMHLDFKGNFKEQFSENFFDEATSLKDDIEAAQKIYDYEIEIDKLRQIFSVNIKCIILTEDENAANHKNSALRILLDACGFKSNEISIQSYNGKDKYQIAIGMAKSLEKLPNITKIIIHQDQDGEYQKKYKNIGKWVKEAKLNKTEIFITKYNDIEGYFVNHEHLNFLFPQIKIEDAINLIENETKKNQTKSIHNVSVALNGNTDSAEIIYNHDQEKYRHTKIIAKSINHYLNTNIKQRANIIQLSPFVSDDKLKELAKNIWPNL